jgi:hypothetical protein
MNRPSTIYGCPLFAIITFRTYRDRIRIRLRERVGEVSTKGLGEG